MFEHLDTERSAAPNRIGAAGPEDRKAIREFA
jgi:hypothetical protein